MVSLLAGLQGIPHEMYEAAKIDGANSIQLFRYITLAQLRPIIISLA
jgi:multiple sugar transport system permease protein